MYTIILRCNNVFSQDLDRNLLRMASSYFPTDDPYLTVFSPLTARAVGEISKEKSYCSVNGKLYANLFSIGTSLIAITSIVDTPTTNKLLKTRFYDQRSLNLVYEADVVLPSDQDSSYMFTVGEEGIVFDEGRRRLYVFSQFTKCLWCVVNCLSKPSVGYTAPFEELPKHSVRSSEVDSAANVLFVLWSSERAVKHELSIYSTETGMKIDRIDADAFFDETADQRGIQFRDDYDYAKISLALNPDTLRVHLIMTSRPRECCLRTVELPMLIDGTGIDREQLLASVSSFENQAVFPDFFTDPRRYPAKIEVAILKNNEYLLQFRNRERGPSIDRVDLCYLTPPNRLHRPHAFVTVVQTPAKLFNIIQGRVMFVLPAGGHVLLLTTGGGLFNVSLDALSNRPWRPETHGVFERRTRVAIRTMMYLSELNLLTPELPPEMLFEIFQHL